MESWRTAIGLQAAPRPVAASAGLTLRTNIRGFAVAGFTLAQTVPAAERTMGLPIHARARVLMAVRQLSARQ